MKTTDSNAIIMLIAASCIWGTTPLFAHAAFYYNVSPAMLVESRLLIGILAFYIIYGQKLSARKMNCYSTKSLLLCALCFIANYVLYHVGLIYTTPAAAQFIESTSPVFVLLFACIVKEEKLSLVKFAGTFICLIGTGLIFHSQVDIRGQMIGNILEMLAAMGWGCFIVQSSHVLKLCKPIPYLMAIFGISALLLFPFAVRELTVVEKDGLVVIVIMGIFHTSVAYYLYFEGLKRTSPVISGIIFALSPIVTLLLSTRVGKEHTTAEFLSGSLILLTGILITTMIKGSIPSAQVISDRYSS